MIAISVSPQHLEAFLAIQERYIRDFRAEFLMEQAPTGQGRGKYWGQRRRKPRKPQQDVKTRFDSTYNMAKLGYKLCDAVDEFVDNHATEKVKKLKLNKDDWDRVALLVRILKPIHRVTKITSVSHGPTAQFGWWAYNSIFNDLEDLALSDSARDWDQNVHDAIAAGKRVLQEKYSKSNEKWGVYLAVAALLDPREKLAVYADGSWTRANIMKSVKLVFDFYRKNYIRLERPGPRQQVPGEINKLKIARGAPLDVAILIGLGNMESELGRYLRSQPIGSQDESVLTIWHRIEKYYPTVAKMARDILPIQVSSIGVERIFNIGRDICNYRRGRLSPDTISQLMFVKLRDR